MEKKQLIKNFIYLTFLQGINFLVPLVTIPYLVRTLDIELYGVISLAFAVIIYFQVLTDWGFNNVGVREIANAGTHTEKELIFNEIQSTKIALLLFSLIIFIVIIFSFNIFRNHWQVYLYYFGVIIGQVFFPIYYFHGIQEMKYLTIINVVSKTISTLLIFLFVRDSVDYYKVPIFYSIGFIISALYSHYLLIFKFKIKYEISNFESIKKQLKNGLYVFLSELKITLFTNTNIVILGFFVGNISVGYFNSAEKFARALGNIQTPFSNTLFPYISKKVNDPKFDIEKFFRITMLIGLVFYLIVILLLFIYAEDIIKILFGNNMERIVLIFRILIFIPLLSFIDTLFGKLFLLNIKQDKIYMKVIVITVIVNLLLIIPLTFIFKEIGTAISLIISQIFLAFGMFFYYLKYIKKWKLK